MSLNSPEPCPGSGLVLLAPGGLADPAAGAALADLLGLRPVACPEGAATAALAALAALAQEPPGWLLTLPLDPGQELTAGGCWADALGAWRQPALLLVPPGAPAGAPRAYAALLQSLAVPLLGLVQLGGLWEPGDRRRDGLPWLGWLPATASAAAGESAVESAVELVAACRLRWREVSGARPVRWSSDPADAADPPV